jgi:hypothetical protein
MFETVVGVSTIVGTAATVVYLIVWLNDRKTKR